MRINLQQVRQSRLPQMIGLCPDNIPGIASAVNEAQQRLIFEAGETGFWGGWDKVLFCASRLTPYITLPSEYCRAINLAVCRHPVRLYNQFYQVLPAGPGLPPDPSTAVDWCGDIQGYDDGMVPTMVDLPTTSYLRLYATDAADVASGKRILIGCLDQNGQMVYSQDGTVQVAGTYLAADTPFVDTTFTVSKILSVTKDETLGFFTLKAVNPTTGVETTLATYGPTEQNVAYRRYKIISLPTNCCPSSCPTTTGTTVQITAFCKREYVPVSRDTDLLIIGNIPALIEECLSIRMSEMDSPQAMSKAEYHHKRAMKQLNNELRHYMGNQVPSVAVDIWDGQPLQHQSIGSML